LNIITLVVKLIFQVLFCLSFLFIMYGWIHVLCFILYGACLNTTDCLIPLSLCLVVRAADHYSALYTLLKYMKSLSWDSNATFKDSLRHVLCGVSHQEPLRLYIIRTQQPTSGFALSFNWNLIHQWWITVQQFNFLSHIMQFKTGRV